MEKTTTVLVFEAPKDPVEKKEWAHALARLQIAMWVDDDARCLHCGQPYASVDNFIDRNPRATGRPWPDMFVDDDCWEAWTNVAH